MVKRRILIYHTLAYPAGGVGTVSVMLVEELFKLGYEVAVAGGKLHEEHLPNGHMDKLVHFEPISQGSAEELAEICNRLEIDLVLAQTIYIKGAHKLRELAPSTRFVTCIHSVPLWECVIRHQRAIVKSEKSPLRKAIYNLWYKPFRVPAIRRKVTKAYRALPATWDAVVVLCGGYKLALEQIVGGEHGERIFAIENGAPQHDAIGLERKKQILYVGRLSLGDKRVDRLLRVWALLQGEFPDWSLEIVGDGADEQRLRALASDLSLQRINWHGWVSDATPYYAESAITCLTSQFEGWPLSLGEAMQQGSIPVAFGATSGIVELIGDCGVVTTPYGEDEYAAGLRRVMADDALRTQLSKKALERAAKFTPEAMAQKYHAMFDYVLK